MKDKKKIIIGVLCALVGIMAVGYAALATQLNITGTASIDSTWKVEITNITESNVVGDATSKETPSYTATTANFSVGLIQPGDSITYDIEISNLGTLKAKVDSINVVMDENDAITYTTSGLEAGDTLAVNEKNTLSVTVAYNSSVTSQPADTIKDITVTINYVQDLGTSSEPSITYDYVIGDQITFTGSNWYVIKNSTADEDYVTLMKETVVSNVELGEYAANDTEDKMSFYYSDTCHSSGYYGYTDYDYSGCDGHNDYEGSKVKEFLEGSYINVLGTDNLKEVDGYMIRLITINELSANLGWSALDRYATDNDNSNVPTWVYQNFGEVHSYWSMTPYGDSVNELQIIASSITIQPVNSAFGVRPVINLLKSSI